MQTKEHTRPDRTHFSFENSDYKNSLDYPNQFVKIHKDFAEVGIDENQKITIEKEYGEKILQFLRIRSKEGDIPYNDVKSAALKRLILLANCHRTMLNFFGFRLPELKNRDWSSEIINEFFSVNLNASGVDTISENIVGMYKNDPMTFPLSLNFYIEEGENGWEARHSVVVLGVLPNGKILCFHRNGFDEGKKAELTTLDKISESDNLKYKYSLHNRLQVEEILKKFRANELLKQHAK